ncbi:MAG: AsmA-like C-terminal region-containing protein [Bdellovibrionota bacterium]
MASDIEIFSPSNASPTHSENIKKEDSTKQTGSTFKPLQIDHLHIQIEKAKLGDMMLKDFIAKSSHFTIADMNHPIEEALIKIDLSLQSLLHPYIQLDSFSTSMTLRNSALEVNKISCNVFDQAFDASFSAQISDTLHDIAFAFSLAKFDLTQLTPYLHEDFAYPLLGAFSVRGSGFLPDLDELENITGMFELKAHDIEIQNINANALIESYIDSNKASLLDAAGFLTLGPIGLLASQGMKVSQSIPGMMGGKTNVQNIHIDIQAKESKMHMQDVAIATSKHRIAAKGSIDLKKQTFEDMRIGFLNRKGCADLVQKVEGPISKPEFGVGKSVLKTLTAPVTSVGKKIGDIATGGCKVFYEGIVEHPSTM